MNQRSTICDKWLPMCGRSPVPENLCRTGVSDPKSRQCNVTSGRTARPARTTIFQFLWTVTSSTIVLEHSFGTLQVYSWSDRGLNGFLCSTSRWHLALMKQVDLRANGFTSMAENGMGLKVCLVFLASFRCMDWCNCRRRRICSWMCSILAAEKFKDTGTRCWCFSFFF